MTEAKLQRAKSVVRAFHGALDGATPNDIEEVLETFMAADARWRGMHPFYEKTGASAVENDFWIPLREAFSPIQRRPDVFLAGESVADESSDAVEGATWVCEMGHFLGLFDQPWLDIPPTNRMCFIRYAEFTRVGDDDLIHESALFIDIPAVMRHAGHDPFPPQTGADHVHPGPLTHDGLLYCPQDPGEGERTMALVHSMVDDLSAANAVANETGENSIPYEVMARSWAEDMIWSGPTGIGATYTIDRYQQQHSYPFRYGLTDKIFNGHVARFAEGNYACFFGWANLTNTPTGGFLGMPASNAADMRVVDVYRRDGDKLAENWVFIDLLHWLSMQGLDALERMRQLNGKRI